MTVTSPEAGFPFSSRTSTETGRTDWGRLVAGTLMATFNLWPGRMTGMATAPTARCADHHDSASAGRTRVSVQYTLGEYSALTGTSSSAVFFSSTTTRWVSTRSDSTVSSAVPLNGAFTSNRATSPGR